jgi:hypothetical protein
LGEPGRIDEAAGWPRIKLKRKKQRRARRINSPRGPAGWPFPLTYDENPIEWVKPKRWRRERVYQSGPLKIEILTLSVLRNHESVTTVSLTVEIVPRGIIGWLLVSTVLFRAVRETMANVVSEALSQRHMRLSPDRMLSEVAIPGELEEAVTRLDASPYGHVVTPLVRWLLAAAGEDVVRIRPLEIASDWRLSPPAAVDTCLQAAALGLIQPNWELVCAACGTVVNAGARLTEVPDSAKCPSCQSAVYRDLAQTVELTFSPTEAVRRLEPAAFDRAIRRESYAAEFRVSVSAGKSRVVSTTLAPGTYRLEALESGDNPELTVSGGRVAAVAVASGISIAPGTEPGTLLLVNRGGERQTAVVSRLPRSNLGLRGNRAVTQQSYADLFSGNLREVGGLTIGPIAVTVSSGLASLAEHEGRARIEGPALDQAQSLHRLARRGDFLIDLTIAGDAAVQQMLQGSGLAGVRRKTADLPDGAYEEVVTSQGRDRAASSS